MSGRHQQGGVVVRPWVLSLLAIVVSAVWAVNILAGLVVSTWTADAGVNAVMGALLALIGAIGGKSLLARSNPTEPVATEQEGGDGER